MANIANKLIDLTREISLKTQETYRAGLLGGEYGYGADFETDVFKMHPYCWCDDPKCEYCGEIGTEPQLIRDLAGMKYAESDRRANFEFKPTGGKVWWYKYIGRGQEEAGELPPDWYEQCVNSIWEPGDTYYDLTVYTEYENQPQVELCFDVFDRENTTVVLPLSPFADSQARGWDLDHLIQDAGFNSMGDEDGDPLIQRVWELDKKYPNLRERIRASAEFHHRSSIKWHRDRLQELKEQKPEQKPLL